MSNLRRSASLDRLLAETDFRHKIVVDRSKCGMLGYPYCCTGHYYSYRYWPYYLDHRVADHGVACCCGHARPQRVSTACGCSCYRHPHAYYYSPELWPEYYSEYVRGYDYGLWKYSRCPSTGACVWCPRYRRVKA